MRYATINDRIHIVEPHAGPLCRPYLGSDHARCHPASIDEVCHRCVAAAEQDAACKGTSIGLMRLRMRLVCATTGISTLDLDGRVGVPRALTTRLTRARPVTTRVLRGVSLILACPESLFVGADALDVLEYPVPVWHWYEGLGEQWALGEHAVPWEDWERAHIPPGTDTEPELAEARVYWLKQRITSQGRPVTHPEVRGLIEPLLRQGHSVNEIHRHTGVSPYLVKRVAVAAGITPRDGRRKCTPQP